jgi:hypothetical protein
MLGVSLLGSQVRPLEGLKKALYVDTFQLKRYLMRLTAGARALFLFVQ